MPVYPEADIINPLLESPLFDTFYQAQREKIKGMIYWAQDVSLLEGVKCRGARMRVGTQWTQIIRLKLVPPTLDEAIEIASLLEHYIVQDEGFPLTETTEEFEDFSAALNAMLHDPIVIDRLRVYDFDILSQYHRESKETQRVYETVRRSPWDYLENVGLIITYVSKCLEWELVSNQMPYEMDEFLIWFGKRYPDIVEQAQELRALVKEIGFDTPETMGRLYRVILAKYKLHKHMVVSSTASAVIR